MGRRTKVTVVRGGTVAQDGIYEPMQWDQAEERAASLAKYRPTHRPEEWAVHAEVVCDLVLRLQHDEGPLRDRHWAGTLHAFFTWARDHHYSTDPVDLLRDPRISDFVEQTYTKQATRNTHAYRLHNTAALIFPPEPTTRSPRTAAQPPHSNDDRARFLAAAQRLVAGHRGKLKTKRKLHRNLCVILAVTFGAGCDAMQVHRLREDAISIGAEGAVWLTRPGQDFPIPVAEPWAGILTGALSGDPGRFLVAPTSTGKRNECVGKVLAKCRRIEPTLKGFDTDRAAKNWKVQIMAESGFDVVARMCGFAPGSSHAADLSAHLPARTPADSVAIARDLVQAPARGVDPKLAKAAQESAALTLRHENDDTQDDRDDDQVEMGGAA